MTTAHYDVLSPQLVARINAEHLIETPIRAADLAFIFGTRAGVGEFVDAVAALWERRLFRWAIVTGGITPGADESEARIIQAKLVERGIPREIILMEERATNTGENVIYSLPVLEEILGLANIASLIAVGKICTSRRYLMTLQRHWPAVEKMLLPVNYLGVPRADWHLHAHARARIYSEWSKIEPYRARGFIADWPAADDRRTP